ncbi:FAD-dependent monooxygenase [Acuticoccus kandeliae]|uniref:FAD-dependent monooxygenase n=1 Tax=Acuticoccus kandeliae TaxID=2073160 RepID=UPI000D3EACD1|nr:FAD-dependent monooxygenase [Acuticoccus kandeliae]
MKNAAEVLVVGAGPVGLFLATELTRAGIDTMIVDQMGERAFFSKALGITARTLEIFEDLGIAHEAIDHGIWLRGLNNFDDLTETMSFDIPPGLPFGSLALAQFETERILENCLHTHGGRVQYGTALDTFTETADGIEATLIGPDGARHTVGCRYIVGCDGAHSKVRSTLGIAFEGEKYPQTFVLGDLEVDWDLTRGRFYRFGDSATGVTLAAVPVAGSPKRYRLSSTLPAGAEPPSGDPPPTLEELKAMLLPYLPKGTGLSNLHWSSVYHVSHRIVPEYGRGRAFIAGDAAHIHPPVGGLGMNTGLQDAHNLAWKLALALKGVAAPGLLASYSAERQAVGLDVVESTSRALSAVFARKAPTPGMRETQLLVGYRDSPIVADDRADAAEAELAAGDRAPNAGGLTREYVQRPFRLHERFGRGRHVLLGAIGADAGGVDRLAAMAAHLRDRLGTAAAAYAIAPAECALMGNDPLPILADSAGEFGEAYAARPGMAWLVRPDGYLGWVSGDASPEGLSAALDRVAAPL